MTNPELGSGLEGGIGLWNCLVLAAQLTSLATPAVLLKCRVQASCHLRGITVALDASEEHQNDDYQQDYPNAAAGKVSPVPAVRPVGYAADQQDDQHY